MTCTCNYVHMYMLHGIYTRYMYVLVTLATDYSLYPVHKENDRIEYYWEPPPDLIRGVISGCGHRSDNLQFLLMSNS